MIQNKKGQFIAITPGEPAGIGPDICLDLMNRDWTHNVVILSDPKILRQRAKKLGRDINIIEWSPDFTESKKIQNNTLLVWPHLFSSSVSCGELNPKNSPLIIEALNNAISGCQKNLFNSMVTGPIHKSVINDAGIKFTGHTEYIANKTQSITPVMLLDAGGFRVALVTTHIPLNMVSSMITPDRLTNVINVINQDMKKYFQLQQPKIVVCGLNPHAGENGYLGSEEKMIIEPTLKNLKKQGLNLVGPASADTVYIDDNIGADVFLAMYHDQGLPVLKYKGFGNAVNITLGLPFLRTSVDHGTALDMAGSGKAKSDSLISAVELALKMAS